MTVSQTPLSDALKLKEGDRIALTGGGGKTAVLYILAAENLPGRGLYTTTTRMFDPSESDHPFQRTLVLPEDSGAPVPLFERESCFVSAGKDSGNLKKVIGLSNKTIESWKCIKEWPILVIEADGAAQKPIKAPREGEPVIPSCVNKVAGCIGLDSLGKPVSPEWVHRCDLFTERFCRRDGERVDPDMLINLITHPLGLFQNAPAGSERWVILNKMDCVDPDYDVVGLLRYLKKEIPGIHVLASVLKGRRTVICHGE